MNHVPGKIVAAVAGAVIVLWLAGCATHKGRVAEATAEPRSCNYTLREDVVYTPADWPETLAGDVYQPECAGPHPGVLLVHGGGWERRSPDDMDAVAERLAKRGHVVFNIAYRFAPEYTFPAQVHDLQQATRWLRAHAGDLSLDAERIAGFGYSSGAHLVALLGMIDAEDDLDTPYGGSTTRLQAVVAGGTPADLRAFEGSGLIQRFLGTTLAENPGRYARASPLTHIDADDPPTFLYHGGWDTLVPASQARNMYARLQAAGVPAELYIVNGYGHITLFTINRSSVNEAIGFLDGVLGQPAAVAE